MLRALGPLRRLLSQIPWPAQLVPVSELADDLLDRLYVLDFSLEPRPGGFVVWAALAWEGELAFALPGFDALELVVGGSAPPAQSPTAPVVTPPGEDFGGDVPVDVEEVLPSFPAGYTTAILSLTVGPEGALTVHDVVVTLRLPPGLFKPVPATPGAPVPERAGITVRGSLALDMGLNLRIYGFDRADLAPAMVGSSGVIIAAEGVAFDLQAANPQIVLERGSLWLPGDLVSPDLVPALPRLSLEQARIGPQGVTGSLAADWPLVFDEASGAFVYRVPTRDAEGAFVVDGEGDVVEEDRPATLFGLSGGLRHIALRLEQNQLTACEITGGLLVPYFDEPVEIRVNILAEGDVSVTLLAVDADGLTLRKEELLALSLKSLTVAKEGDVGLVRVSGGLEPLLRASEGMQWPRLDVTDLEIDTEGHFRIREAWLDLKDLATLDLFGFHFELSRIGLGWEEERDRLWVDLSGSLRLIEQIPVGLGVEGFRISWPRDLDEIVDISTPPTLQNALDVIANIEVQFDGIYLFFGVPDAVEFEGLIRFIKTAQVVGFAGDVALRVPASGFAAEAGLMVGMNFEPPPYPFLYVYFGVELPAGIPLGQSGLALKGALGLFGLNVSPAKAPEENWYYDWYKRPPIVGAHPTNKWQPERSALSFGAGLTITTADGYVKGTRGLLVFSIPGPVLIIEGRALLLSGLGPGEPPLRALAVLDGREQTVQFNVEARAELVEDMLDASGGLEAFFDFKDLTNWHVYLGQDTPEDRRIQANIFKLSDADRFLFNANGYYMVDMTGAGALRSRMGVFVGLKQQMKYDPLTLDLDAWIEGAGQVTVRPEQFSGELKLAASVKISTFGFGCQVGASAKVMSAGPDPFRVGARVTVSADLPDPLEDLETEFEFEWQSESPPPAEFLLVGAVADSDLAPRGGELTLHGTILHQRDGDVLTRLSADEGRLGEADAEYEAEHSPVVPLDARPTLLFAHDMNDDSDGHLARDIGDAEYAIGRFRLEPALQEVTLYEHPRAERWTGDFASDWTLVASSDPDIATSDAERLWGVWLADSGVEDPSAAGARRLRLWTSNPFVYARRFLGAAYQRVFQLLGPRVSPAEAFLDDHPTYLQCRGTERAEVCFDFADAPTPPKPDEPKADRGPEASAASAPAFTHGGVTFTGDTRLEPHPDGPSGVCLATRGKLRLRFPAPVVQVRLTFCREPHLSAGSARGRLTVRRDEVSERDAAFCAIDVPYEVEVDGRSWTVSAEQGFDCLDLTRPEPLEGICLVTLAEAARATRAGEQCEQNDEAVAHFGLPPPSLKPGTYYRLIVKSTVDLELPPSDSPLAAALDAVYGARSAP